MAASLRSTTLLLLCIQATAACGNGLEKNAQEPVSLRPNLIRGQDNPFVPDGGLGVPFPAYTGQPEDAGYHVDLPFPPEGGVMLPEDASVPPIVPDDAGRPATAEVTAYRIVRIRNIASPVSEPMGIAHDGEALWLSGSNRLVRFDPDSLEVDREHALAGHGGGTQAYGITWDGSAVWHSISGNTNELQRIEPSTGNVLRRMSSPSMLGPSDLDFDGTHLWLSSGTGDIFSIRPTDGGIEHHFTLVSQSSGRDHGIAVREGELWVGRLFGGLDVYDSESGAYKGSVRDARGDAIEDADTGASCFVGDQLVMVGRYGITFYDIVAQD